MTSAIFKTPATRAHHVFIPADRFVGWQLDEALPVAQCAEIVAMLTARGFAPTGAHYPGDYRNNDRLVLDDPALAASLFMALRLRLPAELYIDGERWLLDGLNTRFRACRYGGGQAFCIHRDGPYVPTADLRSHLTLQVYLDDDPARAGGHTRFYADPRGETQWASIAPRTGTAIVFDHRAWHDGEAVTAGIKHVLRTDVMYRRAAAARSTTRGMATGAAAVAAAGSTARGTPTGAAAGAASDTTSGPASDTTSGSASDATSGSASDATSGSASDATSGSASDATSGPAASDATSGPAASDATSGSASDTTSGAASDTTSGSASDTTSGAASDATSGTPTGAAARNTTPGTATGAAAGAAAGSTTRGPASGTTSDATSGATLSATADAAASSSTVCVVHRHRGYAWHAIVCRDRMIASAGRDGTVRLRRGNGVGPHFDATFDLGAGSVTRLVEAADGRLWAGTRAGRLFVLDGVHAAEVTGPHTNVCGTSVSHPSGGAAAILDLAARDGGGVMAATAAGELVAFERNGAIAWRVRAHDGWAWSIVADGSADGSGRFLSCGHGGQLVLVSDRGELRELARLPASLRALGVRGDELLVGDARGVLHWLDREGRVEDSRAVHRGAITSIAPLPGGLVATGGEDGCVHVWCDHERVASFTAADFVTSVTHDRHGALIWSAYDGAIYRDALPFGCRPAADDVLARPPAR